MQKELGWKSGLLYSPLVGCYITSVVLWWLVQLRACFDASQTPDYCKQSYFRSKVEETSQLRHNGTQRSSCYEQRRADMTPNEAVVFNLWGFSTKTCRRHSIHTSGNCANFWKTRQDVSSLSIDCAEPTFPGFQRKWNIWWQKHSTVKNRFGDRPIELQRSK